MAKPTSYNIMISEEQRVALLVLLKASERGLNEETQITGEPEPLVYWVSMLEDLDNESHEPDLLHGFCL